MEKLQTETPPEPHFNLNRRNRSRLRSHTYANLVRILSGCYKHPYLCKTPQIIPQQLPSDDSIVPMEVFKKQGVEHGEMVPADGAGHDGSLVQTNVTSEAFQKQGLEPSELVSADGADRDDSLVQNNVTSEEFQKQGVKPSELVSANGTHRDDSLVQINVPSDALQKQGFVHGEMVSANGADHDDSLVQNNVPSEAFQKQGFERSETVSADCAYHDDPLVQNNVPSEVFQKKQGLDHSEMISADATGHDDFLVQINVPSEVLKKNRFEHSEMVSVDVAGHDDSLVQNNVPGEVFQKEGSELGVSADGTHHGKSLVQKNVPINESVDTIRFQDGGFTNTQDVIYEIENIMRIEDVDRFEDKNSVVDGGSSKSNGLKDKGFFQLQELLMDELEHVMKGNEEVVHNKNCHFSTISLDENQCDSDIGTILNNQAKHFDPQPIVKEDNGSVEGVHLAEMECTSQDTSAMKESLLDKSTNFKDSKLNDKVEEKSSPRESNKLGGNHETQQKEMETGNSVSCIDAKVSAHIIEDGGTEGGQIAGEFVINDRLVHMSHKNFAVPQEQNKQLSIVGVDKNRSLSNDKKKPDRRGSDSLTATADMVNVTATRVEVNDERNEMACKRKVIVYEDPILAQEPVAYKKQKMGCKNNERKKDSSEKGKKKGNVGCVTVLSDNLTSSAKKSNQDANERQGSTCNGKVQQDNGMCDKKKRGPPSEERKQKKKEKKRKKRAEKNRQLGVKRLKLRPVEKLKPVAYCRHYIRGRCQEGEKCKFSHDTTPLTKSKPCCHFARNACLKGDDCPYDHQLSKYPCTNYASTGFCGRGEDCLFSHKLPGKEDLPSTSNVGIPDLKPPPSWSQTSNSKNPLGSGGASHHTAKSSPNVGGILSSRDAEQKLPKTGASHHAIPRGISFLSAGKSVVVESSHSTPGSSSLTTNEDLRAINQNDQRTPGATENLNEIPKRTPATVPKGINFLSFGKGSLELSGAKKLTFNNGAKPSLFDAHKQSSFPLTMAIDTRVGKETNQNTPSSTHWLNRMLQKTEVAASPLKSNLLSFSGSATDESIGNARDSSASSSAALVDRSPKASEISPGKYQNLKTIPQGKIASALGSGQSADYLADACIKNTPSSATKALMSTLAFAAKVESQMKMKQAAAVASAVDCRADNGTEDCGISREPENSEKILKILDFLSSVGDKMKQ